MPSANKSCFCPLKADSLNFTLNTSELNQPTNQPQPASQPASQPTNQPTDVSSCLPTCTFEPRRVLNSILNFVSLHNLYLVPIWATDSLHCWRSCQGSSVKKSTHCFRVSQEDDSMANKLLRQALQVEHTLTVQRFEAWCFYLFCFFR